MHAGSRARRQEQLSRRPRGSWVARLFPAIAIHRRRRQPLSEKWLIGDAQARRCAWLPCSLLSRPRAEHREQREPIKQMSSMTPQDPRVGPEQTLVPPTTRAPEETRENHDSPPEKNRPTRHAVLPGPDTIASGNPPPSVPPHRRCCLPPPQGKYLQSKRRRHELVSRHFP